MIDSFSQNPKASAFPRNLRYADLKVAGTLRVPSASGYGTRSVPATLLGRSHLSLALSNGTSFVQIFLTICFAAFLPTVAFPADKQNDGLVVETFTSQKKSEQEAESQDPEKPLPKLAEMKVPELAELLQRPPVDWIVLQNDDVLVVKPVEPRPDTLAKLQGKRQELLTKPPPQAVRKVGESREEFERRRTNQQEDYHKQRLRAQYLDVSLPDNVAVSEEQDAAVFQLDIEKIKEVIHHEDLMLRRIDQLLDKGQFQTAFEALIVLERSHKGWPGAKARHERLMFEEARKQAQEQPEAGLAMLEQLHTLNSSYSGLSDELGRTTDRLITSAVKDNDYRRARFFLTRLKDREPKHAVVQRWQKSLQDQATERIRQSEEAARKGDLSQSVRHAEAADRIWPALPQLRSAHTSALSRFPSLKVGVTVLPGKRSRSNPPNLADLRQKKLTQVSLFEADRFQEAAHYRTRYFDVWEPTDLGRQTDFVIRPRFFYWESQPVLTASDIVSALSARLDPASSAYDERFAAYVNSLIVRSPFEFTVYFDRVPARLEAFLAIPVVGDGDAGPAPLPATADAKSSTSPSVYPFHVHEAGEGRVVYRRTVEEPKDVRIRHVTEIVEINYESYEKAIQGLLRGEVCMLPEIPPSYVKPLSDDKQFFVVPYAMPTTHVLQFHPRSPAQKNRELRRALAFAIDRESILKDTILREPGGALGRLVTGPFSSKGSAYNELTQQIAFDRTLAISLATVARSQYEGKLPVLRVVCDPDPVAQEAAAAIVENWRQAGLQATLLSDVSRDSAAEPSKTEDSPWDIAYRRVRMEEPLTELWPFLTLQPTAQVGALTYLPVWLRQELIELDSVSDWNSAANLLRRLQDDLLSEVQLIPLWEIDDSLVVRRKTFQTVPRNPMHPYDDVEQWILQPWYPTDTPR